MSDEFGPWKLQWYASNAWTSAPGDEPTKGYELSADRCWATIYATDGRTPTAIWMRPREVDREALRRHADERRAREADRAARES